MVDATHQLTMTLNEQPSPLFENEPLKNPAHRGTVEIDMPLGRMTWQFRTMADGPGVPVSPVVAVPVVRSNGVGLTADPRSREDRRVDPGRDGRVIG